MKIIGERFALLFSRLLGFLRAVVSRDGYWAVR